jgi:hypothetical protein
VIVIFSQYVEEDVVIENSLYASVRYESMQAPYAGPIVRRVMLVVGTHPEVP